MPARLRWQVEPVIACPYAWQHDQLLGVEALRFVALHRLATEERIDRGVSRCHRVSPAGALQWREPKRCKCE